VSSFHLKKGMNNEHPSPNGDINETSNLCSYRTSSDECGLRILKLFNSNNWRFPPDRNEHGLSFVGAYSRACCSVGRLLLFLFSFLNIDAREMNWNLSLLLMEIAEISTAGLWVCLVWR
jgi:hypothetical protein